MPTNIEAIVTDIGRQRLLEGWGQVLALTSITQFKVGEGGWETTPSGSTPRDPTDEGLLANRGPTLVDLDCIANPGDYPADSVGNFTKALAPGDIVLSANTTLTATCVLLAGEFNNDGFGNAPEIYEIGLFNSAGEMVAYGTFPVVTKTPAGPKTLVVRINANRS